jgi:hypothetical protein
MLLHEVILYPYIAHLEGIEEGKKIASILAISILLSAHTIFTL